MTPDDILKKIGMLPIETPDPDPAAVERAVAAALAEADSKPETFFQGKTIAPCLKEETTTKETSMTSTMRIHMNEKSSVLDPGLMREIISSLDEETASPKVRDQVKKWNNAYGSCTIATVAYIGLLALNGRSTPLKPFVARDTEQAGTWVEQHMMLTDGTNLIDFTPAKHGDGEFKLYSDKEAEFHLNDILSESTFLKRLQIVVDRLAMRKSLRLKTDFKAEDVLDAFKAIAAEGRKLKISHQALTYQLEQMHNKPKS